MDDSQENSASGEDEPLCLQPYKRLEFAVNQIVDVAIPLHLQILRKQLNIIENLQAQEKWTSVIAEQVNASNTFRLLKADIHELENLNSLVRPEDADIFLHKIQTPTREAIDALALFSEYHPGVAQPIFGAENYLERNDVDVPLLKCGDSEGEDVANSEKEQAICDLQQVKVREKSKIAQHWLNLKNELFEVNELIRKFADLVFFHRESIDRIEDNISSAEENVREGTKSLSKAVLLKSASIPLAGAIVGGVVFGPVGALVGCKLFGSAACAFGGGILGYGVGRKWKQKQQASCEFEMKAITASSPKSSSTSLPDLSSVDSAYSSPTSSGPASSPK